MFNWCNFLKGRICARKSGSTVQAILKPGGNASDIVMQDRLNLTKRRRSSKKPFCPLPPAFCLLLYFWTAETLPWVDKLPNQSSNTS
ncbi:MAG: hypothetical protein RIE73_29810 [Coleofasciculus sp. C1-SOL-03]